MKWFHRCRIQIPWYTWTAHVFFVGTFFLTHGLLLTCYNFYYPKLKINLRRSSIGQIFTQLKNQTLLIMDIRPDNPESHPTDMTLINFSVQNVININFFSKQPWLNKLLRFISTIIRRKTLVIRENDSFH